MCLYVCRCLLMNTHEQVYSWWHTKTRTVYMHNLNNDFQISNHAQTLLGSRDNEPVNYYYVILVNEGVMKFQKGGRRWIKSGHICVWCPPTQTFCGPGPSPYWCSHLPHTTLLPDSSTHSLYQSFFQEVLCSRHCSSAANVVQRSFSSC